MQQYRNPSTPRTSSVSTVLARIAVLVLIFLVAATVTRLVFRAFAPAAPSAEAAHAIAVELWGDCAENDCDTLSISTTRGEDGVWVLEAIHDGLADDSVRSLRATATLQRADDGSWMVGEELSRDWRCREGRGHDDFSTELCI